MNIVCYESSIFYMVLINFFTIILGCTLLYLHSLLYYAQFLRTALNTEHVLYSSTLYSSTLLFTLYSFTLYALHSTLLYHPTFYYSTVLLCTVKLK